MAMRSLSSISPRCQFHCQIFLLCVFWYTISSASSIINKLTLQRYPYPMTVALASLLSIPLYSTPLLRIWQIKKYHLTNRHLIRFIIPISIGKAFAVASAYFSLWKVPVSYAHTVKATMPLFAVVCARFVLNERQTKLVYLSLIPIMIGVLIASLTELSFNFAGLISALMSTATYALLNVFVKRALKDANIHPITLLALNAQIAALIFFPFWCLRDGYAMWSDLTSEITIKTGRVDGWFVLYLLISGLLSFCQNFCAFTLIHRLTALSYAISNATKRITVISISLLTLQNPITFTNAFGMVLAIFGVFLYNRAKQYQKYDQLPTSDGPGPGPELVLNDSCVELIPETPRYRLNAEDLDSDKEKLMKNSTTNLINIKIINDNLNNLKNNLNINNINNNNSNNYYYRRTNEPTAAAAVAEKLLRGNFSTSLNREDSQRRATHARFVM